jgi:hypothetical protein
MSCVKTDDFNALKDSCNNTSVANIAVSEVFDKASGDATKYVDDSIIEGYVVSSDQYGNFFKSLSMQTLDGSIGFSVAVDQTDVYTIYNPGRKVIIKLKGLYTEVDNDALEIGALYIDNFSNETVGRIAYPSFENVLINSCDVVDENTLVNRISISDISDVHINTLVEFINVQFAEEALSLTLHESANDADFATNHLIQDTFGNTLQFRTSVFANFAGTEVSNKSGRIRGVLTKFDGEYQLLPRSLNDVNLTEERFVIELKNNIFFTELADPNNNSGARFIEIYNAEEEPINLNGWTIRRYTNANTTVSSTLDLSGQVINARQAFVIAANASEFEIVFGFAPDFAASSNSAAGSNGDDNLELVDSEGNVVDMFGVIGEDGSGTNHEFEDGRALRNTSVTVGSSLYTFNQWFIWNDTGDSGTTNAPQNAPADYTPGIR